MNFYVLNTLPAKLTDYKNCILLIRDNWDDWFQYQTQCYVKYVNENLTITDIGEVKIGQFKMGNQRTASYPNEFKKLPENLFSLGQSEDYYENIKNLFDEQNREDYYISLNDMAYNLDIYKRAKKEDVTELSLMRYVYPFMIEHQFNRISKGKAKLTKYKIEYTYPSKYIDSPPKLSFDVKPYSCPPTNIHVVIGKNNVGKTYLIKHLILAAYDKPLNEKQNGILKATNTNSEQLFNSNMCQIFANILCISYSPFDDYQEVKQIPTDDSMPFSFIGLSDNQRSLSQKFVDSLKKCQGNRRKMILLHNALKILETDPIFSQAQMEEMIDLPCYDTQNNDNTENNSNIQKIYNQFSSGHQVIMLSLVQLVAQITERTLVILDEPENHLHPPLLSAFIRALSKLLIEQNGVAIIATHSPVILQEVPKSCIWKINRSGSEVSVSRLEMESFGATITSLMHEVFGLEVNNSGFHKLLIDEVNHGLDYNRILEKYDNELGDEAKSILRAAIFERNKNDKTN